MDHTSEDDTGRRGGLYVRIRGAGPASPREYIPNTHKLWILRCAGPRASAKQAADSAHGPFARGGVGGYMYVFAAQGRRGPANTYAIRTYSPPRRGG